MHKPRYQLTNVSTFSTMIENHCLYVDKTQQMYNLFCGAMNYYFFSRPRRFGKSLLISTLQELFSGNKELFKGLWIEKSDWAWKKYPVIHLDFSNISHDTSTEFKESLSFAINNVAKKYGIDTTFYRTPAIKLTVLVEHLAAQEKVVLLIDEYDKPIIDNIENIKIAEANRKVMKSFYDAVKSLDKHWRAIFITGVSKFAKTSVFSGINNLNDISEKPEAATLLGYTQQELVDNFTEYIDASAQALHMSKQDILVAMKEWYNGYRFSKIDIRVYNPFSVLYYLKDQECANYWIKSGNPTFLFYLLRKCYADIEQLNGEIIIQPNIETFDLSDIQLIPLLYQTGYLTIDDAYYEKDETSEHESSDKNLFFKLKYPNKEVRKAFEEYILMALCRLDESKLYNVIRALKQSLTDNNIEEFCRQLRIMFAQVPYNLHIKQENYYHSLLQIMLYFMGLSAHSEIKTSVGAIDIVIQTTNRIFVIELKFDDPAKKALDQIIEKRYFEKYLGIGKPITLVGITFNYAKKDLFLNFVQQELL